MPPPQPNVFLEQMQEWVAFILKPKTLKLILKVIGFLILLFLLFKMAGCVAITCIERRKVKIHNKKDEEEKVPVAPQ